MQYEMFSFYLEYLIIHLMLSLMQSHLNLQCWYCGLNEKKFPIGSHINTCSLLIDTVWKVVEPLRDGGLLGGV